MFTPLHLPPVHNPQNSFAKQRGGLQNQASTLHKWTLTCWKLRKTQIAIFLFKLNSHSTPILCITVPLSGIHFVFLACEEKRFLLKSNQRIQNPDTDSASALQRQHKAPARRWHCKMQILNSLEAIKEPGRQWQQKSSENGFQHSCWLA